MSYCGEQILVPKGVADFLKQDRKRQQAEAKRDERHLSKGELEAVLSPKQRPLHPVDDAVTKTLRLENLRNAVAGLDNDSQKLIHLRYDEELSVEAIGKIFGVSKMAISKRLKNVHKRLRESVW